MASITATILKHHKKQNDTWSVKIRISHKSKSVYLDTSYVAKKEDLDTKLRLKKIFIDRFLAPDLNRYRDKINALGIRLDSMSAVNIKEYLSSKDERNLDFFEFADEHLQNISDKRNTFLSRKSSVARLREFVKRDQLSPLEIKVKFLEDFQEFLKKPIRMYAIEKGNRSNQSIVNIIRDVKTIFSLMKNRYNDYDSGIMVIPNDPFKIFKPVIPKKSRNKNLTVEQIKAIRDIELEFSADIISRDIFMLSFYLCGINAIDMYHYLVDSNVKRLEYKRRKTMGARSDEAFISINIPEESKDLLSKYCGYLQKRYKSSKSVNNRLSESLGKIGDGLGIDRLTFYHARHTFATLARNECRFSKDDVAAALNHSSSTVTDIYIAKDWSIIDEVQEGVLNLLR